MLDTRELGRRPVREGATETMDYRLLVDWGDGWYGFNLDDVDAVADRIRTIDRFCQESGRDRSDLDIAVALRNPAPTDRAGLDALGVDELVLVESPPANSDAVPGWLDELAGRWAV